MYGGEPDLRPSQLPLDHSRLRRFLLDSQTRRAPSCHILEQAEELHFASNELHAAGAIGPRGPRGWDKSQDHPYCPDGWIVVREPPDITDSRHKSLGRPIFHIADYGTDLDAQEAMYQIFCPELASDRHSENMVSNERNNRTFPTPPVSPAMTPVSYPTPLEHHSSSSGRVQAPIYHTSPTAPLETDLGRNAALRPPRVPDLGTTTAGLSTTGALRAPSRNPYASTQQYQGSVSSASSIITDSSVVPTPRSSANSSTPPDPSTQSSRKRVRSDIEVEEVIEGCRAPRRQRTDAWGFAHGFAIGTAVGAVGAVAAVMVIAAI